MAFLLKLFGIDLETEKVNKFREFESKWASDPEILKHSKVGWLLSRGQNMIQKGYPNQAIRDAEEALQINPESVGAYKALISAYVVVKRFKSADETIVRCLDMIEKSKDEEIKAEKMDILFLMGMLGLETNDAEIALRGFYAFLKEEKKVVVSPVWKKMIEESSLVSEHILQSKGVSLEKEHEEYVKIAKEALEKLKGGLNPEAQKLISGVL